MPITYFGSIRYFRELAKCDQAILEVKEYFPKQSYRNRCDIPAANGMISLSIPVRKPNGSKTIVEEVLIDGDDWKDIHWRTIVSAYQSAPYFDYYGQEIEELIFSDHVKLVDLNLMITERVVQWLDIPVELKKSEQFNDYLEDDKRISLASKHNYQEPKVAPYIQVFPKEDSYKEGLSILDPILCEGPLTRKLII